MKREGVQVGRSVIRRAHGLCVDRVRIVLEHACIAEPERLKEIEKVFVVRLRLHEHAVVPVDVGVVEDRLEHSSP